MKNKILKKILGVAGYKLIEKEVIKNERLISSKSYLKIDRLLDTLFKDKKISNIIQIGANDGIRFDILNGYIKKYKTKSILVEPIKENYEKLKKNYEDCNFISFENCAISTNNEISFLYKVNEKYIKNYDDHIPGITSFNKEHLLKHGVKNRHIICENVSSINMKDLITKHQLKSLDLLYVDAEGYDGKIVIDFLNTTNIKPVIILEFIHIKNIIFESLIQILEENRYKLQYKFLNNKAKVYWFDDTFKKKFGYQPNQKLRNIQEIFKTPSQTVFMKIFLAPFRSLSHWKPHFLQENHLEDPRDSLITPQEPHVFEV